MDTNNLYYVLLFFVPFALSLIFTPIVRIIAVRHGLVSHPRPDRWHKKPTALLGGVSIYLAAAAPFLYLGLKDRHGLGLFLGATFLFIVGLLDDKFRFTPYVKLFAQIIAGGIAILSGVVMGLPLDSALTIPLTLLWIVGVTNSFNLLDNIDGLAAGIAAISSLTLFFSSLVFSNNPLGVFALIFAGAVLGFLPYNFNPAKIFMGDSGSMFLGYSIAVVSIGGVTRHISNLLITTFIPVLILSVPIFDTIFVMIIRKMQGRKVFEGGKDHTSHHLVTLGFSQRQTVLLLYAISAIFGLISISYAKLNIFIVSVITFLGLVTLVSFGILLFEGTSYSGKVKRYRKFINPPGDRQTAINTILLHKRRVLEVLLDFVFICIAYYAAYFLRFEGVLSPANMQLVRDSIIWIILIKMSVFFMFGLYRGVWKYISISDFFTIFKVVSLGSIFSVLFLTFVFRFKDYPRTVFFVDWLILLFLVMGLRFIFRILGEFLGRLQRKDGRRVLIFGAGDMGEAVLREIKKNKELNYVPIGFIDDDSRKIGSKIHGVPVLGTRNRIKDLIKINGINEVIIAIARIDAPDLSDIAGICYDCGISYRKVSGILDKRQIDDARKN